MTTKTAFQCFVARALIVSMSVMMAPQAQGAMIGSERAIAGDRERILILLERPEVAAQLEVYGVSMSDAKARVAALTDAEAAQLSKEIDTAHAGAGGGGLQAMVTAIGIAMMVALVVVAAPFVLLGIAIAAAKRRGPSAVNAAEASPAERAYIVKQP